MKKSPLQYMKIIFLSKVIHIWTVKSASKLYGNTLSIMVVENEKKVNQHGARETGVCKYSKWNNFR